MATMLNHRCTYCPEDNKLRFYPDWEDHNFDKERLKSAGYKWASKQECYVCPRWTPTAEDVALDYVADIGDEDYSPEERAADRAERFAGYRDKRRSEAHGHADTFDAGPSAFGYQSQAKAERAASRHDRHRVKAVSQWSKAEYWQQRTSGVISSALYKSSPQVRRGRLKRLETEQRKQSATTAESVAYRAKWAKIATIEDAELATSAAIALAGNFSRWIEFAHPRTGDKTTLYSLLKDPQDPITGHEAATLYLDNLNDPSDPESLDSRWARHYELRIGYEKAMLEAECGCAADVEMEVGGTIGRYIIHKINKSNASGKVVSVGVLGEYPYHRGDGPAPKQIVKINIERLAEDAYTPPTDESKAKLKAEKAILKAQNKGKPKAPKLINPTLEDAKRLTALMNSLAQVQYETHRGTYGTYQPIEPREMTQATYSANSKGSYAHLETRSLKSCGDWKGYHDRGAEIACKLRSSYPGNNWTGTPYRIVVLTDKPQKPLPLDWEAVERFYDEKIAEVKEAGNAYRVGIH